MRFLTVLPLFAALTLAAPAPAPQDCGDLTCPERVDVINQVTDLMKTKAQEGSKMTDADKRLAEQFVLSVLRSTARTNRKCAVKAKCKNVPAVAKVQDICKKGADKKYDCKL